MKVKATVLSAAVLVCAFFGGISVSGQCLDEFTPKETNNGYREVYTRAETTDEKNKKKESGEKIISHVYVKLADETRFKISLDSDYSGAFSKADDIATFTVLENVYGIANMPEDIFDRDAGGRKEVKKTKRCVLIPKDSKVYGVVDWANSRYPFSLPRKGKIYITVSRVTLEDGSVVPITFAEPITQVANQKAFKRVIRKCKNFKTRECIEGRRPKIPFPTAALGDTASAAILVAGDSDVSKGIGLFSVLTAMVKASGVGDVINPPNAELKAKMVFDVVTEKGDGPNGGWVALSPPSKEKKDSEEDEGKDKKP
jgi:hypothetical protein